MATPRYQKLARTLTDEITSGKYKVGDRFFSQAELMKSHGFSYATVVRALKELELAGYLVRIQGSGTFVKSIYRNPVSSNAAPQRICVYMPWNSPSGSTINYSKLYRALQAQCPSSMALQIVPCSMNPDELDSILQEDEATSPVTIIAYPEAVHLPVIYRYSRHKPTIIIGVDLPGPNITPVIVDEQQAADQAVNYLVEHGHINIAIVSAPPTNVTAAPLLDALHSALQRNGFPADHITERHIHPVKSSAYSVCLELINSPRRITAIIATSGQIAAAVYSAAEEAGRRVPDSLSVISVGDGDNPGDLSPDLTCIEFPYDELAHRTVEVISRVLNEKPAERAVVHARFQIRESVADPALPDSLPIY